MDEPDEYQRAQIECKSFAPRDYLSRVLRKFRRIGEIEPRMKPRADSCVANLTAINNPTIMDILIASYVFNDGVAIMHDVDTDGESSDESEPVKHDQNEQYHALLQEVAIELNEDPENPESVGNELEDIEGIENMLKELSAV
jgi:hypothetical protein